MESTPNFSHLTTLPLWFLLPFSLGLFSLLRLTITFLLWIHTSFLRPGKTLTWYGSWALVTGATDGIGKAIAFELASKGLNLVLLGRDGDKLTVTCNEITSKHRSTKVKSVVLDLAGDLSGGNIRVLNDAIAGLDLGIVVNNAGVGSPGAMYFHEAGEAVWEPMIRVNMEATARVTRAVVRRMVERRRGAVLNIGSGSSVAVPAFPLYALYAASKAFVDQFSRSLHVEYRSFGIDVQCQIPMYVATKMISIKESSLFIPSPEQYAKSAICRIGYEPRCTPYWSHEIQLFFASLLPDFVHNHLRLQYGLRKRSQMKTSPAGCKS